MLKNLAPVVIFAYNRSDHLVKTINALKQNNLAKQSDLYIFSDGPQKTQESISKVGSVREYINSIASGFNSITIVERKENLGLAENVISSVTEVIDKYGKVIALEDDLITSPNFLNFMNDSLNQYQLDKKIWSVTGYNIPIEIPSTYKESVYLSSRACSYGWGTWKDRWGKVDWKVSNYDKFRKNKLSQFRFDSGGHLSSSLDSYMSNEKKKVWAIGWCYCQHQNDAFTIYPVRNLVQNIGRDGSGTNEKQSVNTKTKIDDGTWNYSLNRKIRVHRTILYRFRSYYLMPHPFRNNIKRYLHLFGLFGVAKRIYLLLLSRKRND